MNFKSCFTHSFEYGKASHRHKIYYNNVEELIQHIGELDEAGLDSEVEVIKPKDLDKHEESTD